MTYLERIKSMYKDNMGGTKGIPIGGGVLRLSIGETSENMDKLNKKLNMLLKMEEPAEYKTTSEVSGGCDKCGGVSGGCDKCGGVSGGLIVPSSTGGYKGDKKLSETADSNDKKNSDRKDNIKVASFAEVRACIENYLKNIKGL